MKKLRMILSLALILCFVVGCQDKEAMAEIEAIKAQVEVEEQNKELVRRYAEAEDNGTLLDIIDEIVSPDVINHFPNGYTKKGIDYIKKSNPQFYKAFPDMKHTIEFQIAEGDLVATRYIWRGTHKGNWMGIEPTGKEVTFTILNVSRIRDGKRVVEK